MEAVKEGRLGINRAAVPQKILQTKRQSYPWTYQDFKLVLQVSSIQLALHKTTPVQTNSSTSPISTLADHPSPNCSAQVCPTSPLSVQLADPIQTNSNTLATSPISTFLVYPAPVRKAKVIPAANKCAKILTSVDH